MTFEKNLAFVAQHNQEAADGVHTFTVGINEYADLTVQEFKDLLNGFNKTKNLQATKVQNLFTPNDETPPKEVDWRPKVT